MASSSATTLDTLITLKVTHDGATKRLKMPLRDLGQSNLEDNVSLYSHRRKPLPVSRDRQDLLQYKGYHSIMLSSM
jgi:hypothetical protein